MRMPRIAAELPAAPPTQVTAPATESLREVATNSSNEVHRNSTSDTWRGQSAVIAESMGDTFTHRIPDGPNILAAAEASFNIVSVDSRNNLHPLVAICLHIIPSRPITSLEPPSMIRNSYTSFFCERTEATAAAIFAPLLKVGVMTDISGEFITNRAHGVDGICGEGG